MSTAQHEAGILRSLVVARQPIVDRAGRVVAYELLFRSDDSADYDLSGEHKTVQVIAGTISAGLERMSRSTRLFCNADRGALTGRTPLVLPPRSTTIEVLETVEIDDEVVAGCRDLVAQGYQLALDDFSWSPRAAELLEIASVVKIDLLACTAAEVVELVERCRPHGVTLLAEKVETSEQLAWATSIGFELFQGYVIQRPEEIRTDSVAPSTFTLVELTAQLASADVELDELAEIIRTDPGLSLQVLQLAAVGADHGLKRQVHSVHEALVLMGTARVGRWAALAVLSSVAAASPDAFVRALARARTCETLARGRSDVDPGFAFTAGLISSLDDLLGVPASRLAAALEIDESLKAAAFDHTGSVGQVVGRVMDHEAGQDLPGVLVAEAFAWALEQAQALEPTAA